MKQNLFSKTNKITNHFPQVNRASQRSTYSTPHPRQIELSKSVVDDPIIELGLPLSIIK